MTQTAATVETVPISSVEYFDIFNVKERKKKEKIRIGRFAPVGPVLLSKRDFVPEITQNPTAPKIICSCHRAVGECHK